jgi:hypothetical protein
MTTLQEDDDDGFKKQFSQFIKNGVTSESVSISYIYVHQSLRNVLVLPDMTSKTWADFAKD